MDQDDLESLGPERPDPSTQRPTMRACAMVVAIAVVVVAIAAVVIAYQEAQQTRFQRRQDCLAASFAALPVETFGNDNAGPVIEARRRCYGLSPTSTTTPAPKHATATARR
jgi:hypothetical protein